MWSGSEACFKPKSLTSYILNIFTLSYILKKILNQRQTISVRTRHFKDTLFKVWAAFKLSGIIYKRTFRYFDGLLGSWCF